MLKRIIFVAATAAAIGAFAVNALVELSKEIRKDDLNKRSENFPDKSNKIFPKNMPVIENDGKIEKLSEERIEALKQRINELKVEVSNSDGNVEPDSADTETAENSSKPKHAMKEKKEEPFELAVGTEPETGKPITIDLFDSQASANANGFICGEPGYGKSYHLLSMVSKCRLADIPTVIIASEKNFEFKKVCDSVEGTFIEISKKSPNTINPLEIMNPDVRPSRARKKVAAEVSLLKSKISSLIPLFELSSRSKFDEVDRANVVKLLTKTYNQFGITDDNDSLWADEKQTAFKKMPVFSDVKEALENLEDISPRVISVVEKFVSGTMSNFNGQTNISLDDGLIVFGLQNNPEGRMPAVMYITMSFIWDNFQKSRTGRKLLFIDEWKKMAVKPLAAKYAADIAKQIRAYSGGIWFATQQIADIAESNKRALSIINSCHTKILLEISDNETETISSMLGLNANEKDEIENFKMNEALLVSGSSKKKIVLPSEND